MDHLVQLNDLQFFYDFHELEDLVYNTITLSWTLCKIAYTTLKWMLQIYSSLDITLRLTSDATTRNVRIRGIY